jgi:plastocyanin
VALAVLLALAVLAGCGGGDDAGEGAGVAGSPDAPVTEVTIVSEGLDYSVEHVYVPAGVEVTITYDNRDRRQAHNIHLLVEGEDLRTPLRQGPAVDELVFTIDEPGTYTFVCDLHPTMRGRVEVV